MRIANFSYSAAVSAILLGVSVAASAGSVQLPKKAPAPPPRPAQIPKPAPQITKPAPQPPRPAPSTPAATPTGPGGRTPLPGQPNPAVRPSVPASQPGTPVRPPIGGTGSSRITPGSTGTGVPGGGVSGGGIAGGAGKPAAPPRPAPPSAVDQHTGKVTVPENAKVTPSAGGGKKITTPNQTINVDKNGKATSIQTTTGTTARIHNGKVTTVSKESPDGSRVMTHTSPTGARTVNYTTKDERGHPVNTVVRGDRVYREHDVPGRPGYRQRTTMIGDRQEVSVYRTRVYRGYDYPVYVPAYTYAPAAYAYFGTSWSAPVTIGWGGLGLSSGFGMYFAPTIQYASPDAYVADFSIGMSLQAAQAAQQDAPADGAEPQTGDLQPIPPQVRKDYVQEVSTERQLQASEAAGHPEANPIPGALNPKFTLFQSWSDAEAENNGEQCAITGGDFVRRTDALPDAKGTIAVTVASVAKATPSHCAVGSTVRLPVDVLQDWFNKFIESQQAGYESMVGGDNKSKFPPVPGGAPIPNPDGTATPDDPAVIAANTRDAVSSATKAESELHAGGA